MVKMELFTQILSPVTVQVIHPYCSITVYMYICIYTHYTDIAPSLTFEKMVHTMMYTSACETSGWQLIAESISKSR